MMEVFQHQASLMRTLAHLTRLQILAILARKPTGVIQTLRFSPLVYALSKAELRMKHLVLTGEAL